MSGVLFQGALINSVNEYKADSEAKARKINELRDLLARERKAYAQLMNHYVAKEDECEYLCKLLDDAHGADKNPARLPAYAGEDDNNHRIPVGPRAGQRVTRRDHIFLDTFIRVFRKNYSQMISGDWKSWISGDLFE